MKVDMNWLAAEAHVRTMQLMPPLIPFDPVSKKKNHNVGKKSQEDEDSTKYISFDTCLNPKDKHSEKVTRKLRVFEDGTPKEYCKWWIDYDDLVSYSSFAGTDARISLLQTILKGKVRDLFATSSHARLKQQNDAEEDPLDKMSAEHLVEHALDDMAHDIFKVPNAYCRQKHYMCNGLFLSGSVRDFGNGLMELNKYLPYFPSENNDHHKLVKPRELASDKLNEICSTLSSAASIWRSH